MKSLRNQIDTSAKVPDWAESKIYTAADRINSVDDYMKHRTNLGHVTSEQREKLTKIEGAEEGITDARFSSRPHFSPWSIYVYYHVYLLFSRRHPQGCRSAWDSHSSRREAPDV